MNDRTSRVHVKRREFLKGAMAVLAAVLGRIDLGIVLVGHDYVFTNAVECFFEHRQPLAQIRGMGVGIPGPVDQENGIVLEAVNLNWGRVPLSQILADELEIPITLLNDVDAGVYGEYRFGAAKSARTALGIFPGTGIGGGVAIEATDSPAGFGQGQA